MTSKLAVVLLGAALMGACFSDHGILPPGDDQLALGTWGGENAGVIVDDTVAHVHVGCTYGNFSGPVALDNAGNFSVPGEYLLRAYPIAIGPPLPAQFAGTVHGNKLTLTVTVNDTIEKTTVVKGPVTVTFGREPKMGPCPICQKPRAIAVPRQVTTPR